MNDFFIEKGGLDLFKKHKDEFWQIYHYAFTHFPYINQYINIDEEEPWLISLFLEWGGRFVTTFFLV